MCYHIKQTKTPKELTKRFKAKVNPQTEIHVGNQISGFNFSQSPVITDDKKGVIQNYNWGLIPSYAENKDIRSFTLNAKIETLTEKPSFKDSVNERCLVIANGFYEWKWHDSKGRNKEKFLIGLENEELFAFAGIYSSWVNPFTNEIVNSYSIITTEANELMAEIHNMKKRMPIVLTQKNEKEWLNGSEIQNFKTVEVDLIAISQEQQKSLF
ncbi:MAG: SOS response-associated peptidase [Flavobacteriales bacterium]